MNRYTTYCTPEQVKKALELGAQPEIIDSQERVDKENERIRDTYGIHSYEYKNVTYYLVEVRYRNSPNVVIVNQVAYKLPTTEQMRGWLRKEHKIHVRIDCEGSENYVVQLQFINSSKDIDVENNNYKGVIGHKGYPSEPEATLAAIDAALEYLKIPRNSNL